MEKKSDLGFLGRHPLLIAFIFMALCLMPVMIMRDFSPDNELRYLQIADEAIEDGSVFAFTLQGEPYADKPPLYLWIVILSRLLLGKHSMFLLSLFSLLPAFVIIAIMDRWSGLEKASERVGVAFMMMTCALFLGMSVFLRMDMLMTMFIVLALHSFWQLYEGTGNRKRQEILLPVWIFLALFTKGPVGILMPPVAIACFLLLKRKGREIGKYLGWKTWGIIAGLCLVWFAGVYLDGGKAYLDNLLFHQTMGRAVNSFHHKAPFWYYFVAIWAIVAPYMFLLVGAVIVSLLRPSEGTSRSDREVFFCTTVVSTFVMLSLFSGKLAIYLAPVMPFMVLLFVEVLRRVGWRRWMTWSLAIPAAVVAVLALGLLIVRCFGMGDARVSELFVDYPFLRSGPVWFAVGLLLAGHTLALCYLVRGRRDFAVIMMGTALLLAAYSASSVTPQLNDWIGWGNLCKTISPDETVATVYMRRPYPMKVYLGRDIHDYDKDFAAFHAAEVEGRSPEDGSLVLVTRTKRLGRDAGLEAFAKANPHWFVGPYCLVSFRPEEP